MRARLIVTVVTIGACALVIHAAHAHLGSAAAARPVPHHVVHRAAALPAPPVAPCTTCAPAKQAAGKTRAHLRAHGWFLRRMFRPRRVLRFWRRGLFWRARHPVRWLTGG